MASGTAPAGPAPAGRARSGAAPAGPAPAGRAPAGATRRGPRPAGRAPAGATPVGADGPVDRPMTRRIVALVALHLAAATGLVAAARVVWPEAGPWGEIAVFAAAFAL